MNTDAKKLVEDLLTEHKRVKAEFQKKAQESFKILTTDFFEKNPGLTSFQWTQYVPYFNDGDECEFTVGEVYFTNITNEEDFDYVTSYGEWDGEEDRLIENGGDIISGSDYFFRKHWDNRINGVDPDYVKFISETINSGDMQDVLEEMFGVHVKVKATKDGFTVDEYEHD